MTPADRLAEYVSGVLDLLSGSGIEVLSRRELTNGIRVEFARGAGSCGMNFYYSSRKGFSIVPSGGDSVLAESIMAILSRSSGGTQVNAGEEPSRVSTWIGSDEAGKGDYMGPLTAAAVAVDRRIAADLRELGVRDSKTLSDGVLASIAHELKGRAAGRFSVVSLSPLEYNRRMEQLKLAGKNSLDLLAECHAKAISRLISEGSVPDLIVIDRFCSEKRVAPLLPEGGYRLELRERGESDTAVAAASILARDAYMEALRRMTGEYGIKAVAGSGRSTDKVVRRFVDEFGPDILHRIVKVHFSNTSRVLSLFD